MTRRRRTWSWLSCWTRRHVKRGNHHTRKLMTCGNLARGEMQRLLATFLFGAAEELWERWDLVHKKWPVPRVGRELQLLAVEAMWDLLPLVEAPPKAN